MCRTPCRSDLNRWALAAMAAAVEVAAVVGKSAAALGGRPHRGVPFGAWWAVHAVRAVLRGRGET
jgi:hypothetical protein